MNGKAAWNSSTVWWAIIALVNFLLTWRGYTQLDNVNEWAQSMVDFTNLVLGLVSSAMTLRGRWKKDIKPLTSILPKKAT